MERLSGNARRVIAYVTISIEWLIFSSRQARAEPDTKSRFSPTDEKQRRKQLATIKISQPFRQ
jgi:hypothetical protein